MIRIEDWKQLRRRVRHIVRWEKGCDCMHPEHYIPAPWVPLAKAIAAITRV
jgi:hypothetical protein